MASQLVFWSRVNNMLNQRQFICDIHVYYKAIKDITKVKLTLIYICWLSFITLHTFTLVESDFIGAWIIIKSFYQLQSTSTMEHIIILYNL